jgi:hypothetical protein
MTTTTKVISKHVTKEQAQKAKEKMKVQLSSLKGMSLGIGKSGDDYVIAARFKETPPAGSVPSAIDGVSIEVQVTGEIEAQNKVHIPLSTEGS